MPNLDTLTIEIEGTSEAAAENINNLVSALQSLKSATSGAAGLGKVATQLQKIVSATSGATAASNKLQKLVAALNGLNSIQKPSGLNSAVRSLAKLNTLDFSDVSSEKTRALVSALGELNAVQKASGLNSTLNSLKKIPEITKNLETANLEKFKTQMQEVADAVRPLAAEMERVSRGFSAFPIRIQRLIQSNQRLQASNEAAGNSFGVLGNIVHSARAKFTVYMYAVRRLASVMADWVTSANAYIESTNLFSVSMGGFYEKADAYAELVSEKLGIDPREWKDAQGTFMIMAKGFGLAKTQAYKLSKGLTELAYDISSLKNIDATEAVNKLRSALAGELEPIRGLGISISQATLQEYALTKGITESVNAMTEQEKALLRSVKVLEDATRVGYVGDFIKTLESPANSMRILKQQIVQLGRALGTVLLPIITQILPWVQAFVSVLTDAIKSLAVLVGFTMPEWKTTDWSEDISIGADDAASALGGATKAAKEFKRQLIGIDELTILQMPEDSGGAGAGAGALSDWVNELEIPNIWDDAMLADVKKKSDIIKEKLKGLLPYIESIGVAFAAWIIPAKLLKGVSYLSGMSGKGFGFEFGFKTLGLSSFLADMNQFTRFLKDFQANGATLYNVAGMIGEFSGMLGDALMVLGNLKVGGVLKIVQSIGEIITAFSDIKTSDINWDNLALMTRGATNFAIGLNVLTGNVKGAAWSVALQGLLTVVKELGDLSEAVRTGDWSGFDKIALITGSLQLVGGLAVALSKFSKIKAVVDTGGITSVATAADNISGATAALNPKLSSLARNLGFGIIVMGEVAAAAVIAVGSIAILGWELEQVGNAWKPVIENGENVAAGIAIGASMLGVIGAVTAGLWYIGASLTVSMGIGIAVLAETGVATGLFLAELWLIGKALDEVGKAWVPVLNNGEAVKTGIAVGSGLLAGIGIVTAALGGITIAGAGALPVAIAIGAGVLLELGVATLALIENLSDVSDSLTNRLSPSLVNLNAQLPALTQNMGNFAAFMEGFAGYVVAYSKSSVIAGLAGTVETIVGFFTKDPLEKLQSDVERIHRQAQTLNGTLATAVPEIDAAMVNVSVYYSDVEQIAADISAYSKNSIISEIGASVNKFTGYFAGNPLKKIANSAKANYDSAKTLNEKLKTANVELETVYYSLSDYVWFLSLIQQTANGNDFSTISNAVFVDMQGVGSNLVYGFTQGINNAGGFAPIVSELNYTMGGIARAAFSWGRDLTANMANGIYNGTSWVVDAVRNVANYIYSYLHFSEPDIGPLSDFSTYMPDMLQTMATGIRDNSHLAIGAVSDLAGSMAERLQPVSGDYRVNVDSGMSFAYNDADDIDGRAQERNQELISVVFAAAQQIIRAINDKDMSVNIDGAKVAQNVTNAQDSRARMLGHSPAFV